MSITRYLAGILILACSVSLAKPASAKEVTLNRILNDHLMHVVTTEAPATISKYVVDLRLKDSALFKMSDLVTMAPKLKNAEGVLFIIDRSKAGALTSEEERLLPYPSAAVDPSQVILYSKKAAKRNAWEILISAPNEKWLRWELQRLCNSNLRNVTLDEKGSVLDRYIVKRLLVVSTEGKDLAERWINSQTRPGGDAIDWDFIEAQSWSEGTKTDIDTVMLFDRQKLNKTPLSLNNCLPKDLQTWLSGASSCDECCAAKKIGENNFATYLIVAPSARHLQMTLAKYASLESIPESASTQKLLNLTEYGKLVVVARAGDRSKENEIINDFGSKLNSSLAATDLGFICTSKQDLKELIFEGDNKIETTNLEKIQKKIGKNCALVIADLTAVDCSTSYHAKTPVCVSQPYPAFSEAKPRQPSEPDPDEVMLFKGHKYRIVDGDRRNDPHYIEDRYNWKNKEMPKYYEDLRQWERKSEDYEYKRREHEMQWKREIEAVSTVRVTGNMRIYDAADLGTDTAGQLLYSCSLSGSAESTSSFKTDQVSVRGEGSSPASIDVPSPQDGVADKTLISDAIQRACIRCVEELKQKTVLPTDMIDFVAPAANSEPEVVEVKTEHVSIEAVGVAKAASKPSGDAIDKARDAAKTNACASFVTKIMQAVPEAIVTEDDVKDNLTISSEGWNAKTREYRVRFKFEGDVPVAEKKQAEE